MLVQVQKELNLKKGLVEMVVALLSQSTGMELLEVLLQLDNAEVF